MTAAIAIGTPRRVPTVLSLLSRFRATPFEPTPLVRPTHRIKPLWVRAPWADLRREQESGSLGSAESLSLVLSPVVLKEAIGTATPKRRSSKPTPKLGIDLAERGVEVRKLFYAAFARGLARDGYDPEDALQEVYRGLLARNNGTCPFNPAKSSFGHYVHIVTRCVLANWIRKERRRNMFESNETAVARFTTEESGRSFKIDGASEWRYSVAPSEESIQRLVRDVGGSDPRKDRALRMLIEGHSRKEVIGHLGVDARWLEGVLGSARSVLTA